MSIEYFKSREFLIIIILIMAITNMMLGSDIYAPALPVITKKLATPPDKVKLSIGIYLFACAAPLLLYGSLADRFGRRPLLIWGLSLGMVGSLLCISIPSIYALLAGRMLQGIGMAAISSVVRAVFVDVFQRDRLTVVLSYLALALAFSPVFAPLLGGFLLHYFGWHSIFIFLFFYNFITLMMLLKYLPETLKKRDKFALKWRKLRLNYQQLFTTVNFASYALASGVSLSGVMIYYAMSPFLLQTELHITPLVYSWIVASITCFILLGRICNIFAVRHWQAQYLVLAGVGLMLISTLTMAIFGVLYHLNLFSIIIPMMAYIPVIIQNA